MPRKKSYLTVTDQFCGAGGSSQGAVSAGAEVRLAMNHWKLAIETHNTNFPNTDHDCADISATDPRRYHSTDILITSPECTNHSLAKGVKIAKKQMDMFASGELDPAAERSRATMWDVARFAEYHNYNAIIVENVVDARKWVMFDSWLHAMFALGYKHRCVYLNSQHCHPTPQSRDRMYVVFWKKGNKEPMLDYTPAAYCPKCEKDVQSVQTWKKPNVRFGKYRTQYVYACPGCARVVEPYYYASFNCMDWSDLGQVIGERDKPLSPKSMSRIQYGLDKYGSHPFQVVSYTPGYSKPIMDPTGTLTTSDHHGLCSPMIVTTRYTSGIKDRVKSTSNVLGTQVGHTSHALCTPFIFQSGYGKEARGVVRSASDPSFTQVTANTQAMIVPFLVKAEHANRTNVRSAAVEGQTQTTRQSMGLVVPPFIAEARGKSKTKQITDALSCVTAGGGHHGLVTHESFNAFLASYYNGSQCTKHITEESGTITTGDRMSLVSYQKPRIEDCRYRMLKPPEIQKAMAFGDTYRVLGNSREKVKQLGNAVTPPAMEWLVKQVVKSLS